MKKTMNSFDSRAAEWDDNPVRREMNRAVAAAIRDAVPLKPTMYALDFGCGTGLTGRGLFSELGKILAVDLSAGMIDQLQQRIEEEKIPSITACRMDIFTDPLSEKFDLIFSAMAMHHVEQTGALLDRFVELLAPGGWIALADLDTEDGSFHQGMDGVMHQGFDRDELISELEKRGFCNGRHQTAHVIEKPGSSYPVFLITARLAV